MKRHLALLLTVIMVISIVSAGGMVTTQRAEAATPTYVGSATFEPRPAPGETVRIHFELHTSKGKLAGQPLAVYFNGKLMYWLQTNSNGACSISYTFPANGAGTVTTVYAKFFARSGYGGSTSKITKMPCKWRLDTKVQLSASADPRYYVTGTFYGQAGAWNNVPVNIRYQPPGGRWTYLETVKTGPSTNPPFEGFFSFTSRQLTMPKDRNWYASSAGDSKHWGFDSHVMRPPYPAS